MGKRALLTGISGQAGSWLAELLLEKDYHVCGLVRRSSTPNCSRIAHLLDRLTLLPGDLTDQSSLDAAVKIARPDECYNLAAFSFVGDSWGQPLVVADITGLGVLRLLEALRREKPDCKFFQASSSELWGRASESPQTETTPFHPRSPYGIAKLAAHWYTLNARESFGLFACCGLLHNMESERRSPVFVTRKITDGAARIKLGLAKELRLGNLDAQRDWGYCPDAVQAMWLMLQQDQPEEFVIATGETHSVKEFAAAAFGYLGLDWTKHVVTDETLRRPAEVDTLVGNAAKARRVLGWRPTVRFPELVRIMVEADLKRNAER